MNHREALQRILLPKRGEPFDVCMLYLIESTQNKERLSWNTRTDVTVPAGAEASFETYFNAFPASYWRRWSQLDSVVLTMKVTGTANIAVYRSKVDGTRVGVSNHLIADDTLDIELPLKNFEDGGWYWFDVTAETDTIISEAAWCAPHAPKPQTLPDGSTIEPAAKKSLSASRRSTAQPTPLPRCRRWGGSCRRTSYFSRAHAGPGQPAPS